MRVKTVEIESDVEQVLRAAEVEGPVIRLTQQLTRELYVRVNKVLAAMGGRWNRKAGAHLFDRNVEDVLAEALGNGAAVDEKQTYQAFLTPDDLARKMVAMAGVRSGFRTLEPSAGRGAIAKIMRALGAPPVCCELNPESAEFLMLDEFLVYEGDFLRFNEDDLGGPFDAIVMNPPFTGGQDVEHVTHAVSMLAPGGVLVAIMSPGWQTGENRKQQHFRSVLDLYESVVEDLPEGTFAESGTNVRTVLVTVRK